MPLTWGTASWTAVLPAGTGLTVLVRVGDTPTPDGSWSSWAAVTNNGKLVDANGNPLKGQYFQYEVILTTADPTATPTLDAISFTFA